MLIYFINILEYSKVVLNIKFLLKVILNIFFNLFNEGNF